MAPVSVLPACWSFRLIDTREWRRSYLHRGAPAESEGKWRRQERRPGQ